MQTFPNRRFFVVIHTITKGLQYAYLETLLAKSAGADGVFLIPDYAKGARRATTEDQLVCLEKIKEKLPNFLIGVNFLIPSDEVVPGLYSTQPDLYQSDYSSSKMIDRSKLPKTEFFLGIAFKYSSKVNITGEELRMHCEKVSALADVPTTSGPATGVGADIIKIREIRSYLPENKRLGIASGVTESNVEMYLDAGVTDFLVATSLIAKVDEENGYDTLDFDKVFKMAEIIHSY